MAASFQQRRLDVTFKLQTGTFDGKDGADTVKLVGLRVEADIDQPGGLASTQATLRIYGMSQDLMNRLTVLAWETLGVKATNTVRVDAGTGDGKDNTTVFFGNILSAMADYQGAPEAVFIVRAQTGYADQIAPAAAASFPGSQSAAVIFRQLANSLGVPLDNNNVESIVTDQYLPGTLLDKVRTLAQVARVDYYYDQGRVLSITPRGVPRLGDTVVLDASSGLVGWPTVDQVGIKLSCLYNPRIIHGGRISVYTTVKLGGAEWYTYALSHRLESEKPGGAWFTHLSAARASNVIRR